MNWENWTGQNSQEGIGEEKERQKGEEEAERFLWQGLRHGGFGELRELRIPGRGKK